ncbi:Rv0361 family membrane protein [Micromonospora sp. bgisy143]|uniref:Rv0361 family membrane protein n=1 Tax=Micromonospora sp. bgisy143 TaxID=3413790 RepID=UPI003EBE1996
MQPPAGSQVSRVPAQRTPSEQLPPAPPTPAPQPRRRRLRTVLTVVGGVLALLLAGGVVTGFVLYNRAAAPDRSAPDVVVVNYLQAALVSRDPNRAKLFTCDGSVPALDEFNAQAVRREQELGVSFSINIEGVSVTKINSSSASVVAVIRRSASVDGIQQSLADAWQFDVQDRDGWRVCTGTKVR